MIQRKNIEKSITLVKQYVDRNKKTLKYSNIFTTFPSFNFYIKGRYDINAILENRNLYLSGITIPISSSKKIISTILNLPKERKEAFFNSAAIVTDFETEYWLYQNAGTISRKKAFTNIEDMPNACSKLYTRPSKGKPFSKSKREYLNKLKDVFGTADDSRMIKMVLACMKKATEELYSAIPLPPAPIVVGDDASKFYCLKVNEIYNKYKDHFGLFKVVYYPLNHSVFEKTPNVLREIIKQIYEIQPDIIYLGTIKGHNFLWPKNKYNPKKAYFDKLIEELSHYAKTNPCIVNWYDKGDYSSSYGLKLIKEGFDSFTSPLKGHYNEGSFPGNNSGPQYAHILNEFAYYPWEKYVELHGQHYINENSPGELKSMTPQQQWMYKRKIEIKTRKMQFEHMHVQRLD